MEVLSTPPVAKRGQTGPVGAERHTYRTDYHAVLNSGEFLASVQVPHLGRVAASRGQTGSFGTEVFTTMTALEYEIRVAGPIPEEVLEEIEAVRVSIQPVVTVLRGPVVDQAALHGLINRLQNLGLDLIEVRRLDWAPAPAHLDR